MSLYMIQMSLHLRLLLAWARQVGVPATDPGYLVHAATRTLFAAKAPQPFALLGEAQRSLHAPFVNLLGYAQVPASELTEEACLAEPLLFSALNGPILDKLMPEVWSPGRRLAFAVRACPVRRYHKTGDGAEEAGKYVEKDAFLLACDADKNKRHNREEVYLDWLGQELARDGAAELVSAAMSGFQLVRPKRKGQGRKAVGAGVRPDARLEGELAVADPDAFKRLLARGIGRHRAFGYGMLLLRPVR